MKKILTSPITYVSAMIVVCIAVIAFFHSPNEMTPAQACREYVKVMCDKLVECEAPTTVEECYQNLGMDPMCDQPFESTVEQIRACSEDLKNIQCDDALPKSCWDLN